MKRMILWFTILLTLLCLSSALAETPPGFGYINADRINVRKGIGGSIVTQLDDGDAVFIVKQQQDGEGRLWYLVNTEYSNDRAITVWVQARYVTAGSKLFSHIVQVAAGENGLLALQNDGKVVGVADENAGTRVFRNTIAQWKNVRQVACGFMTYLALCEDGSLRGFGNNASEDWDSIRNVRLLDAKNSNIAFVTEAGMCNQQNYTPCYTLGKPLDWQRVTQITVCDWGTLALYPDGSVTGVMYQTANLPQEFQHIGDWLGLIALDCGEYSESIQGVKDVYLRPLLVSLHADGTVSTLPENQISGTETWSGLQSVKAGWDFIIGLRTDGTVVFAGKDTSIAQQVSEWADIKAIDASMGYCVGLKTDGTLLFAGAYTF